MTLDPNPDHRPVTPFDFPGGLAEAWQAGEAAASGLTVDPLTRRILPPGVPDWLTVAYAEALKAAEAQAAIATAEARAAARVLRGLVSDADAVAGDLRALMYLYLPAVANDGRNDNLTAASHLVIDCIRTMADRLSGLEARAAAAYAPLIPEPRP